jgi:ribosomal protein L35
MKPDGSLWHKKANMRHNMRKKTSKQKMHDRGFFELHPSDYKCIARCLPYGTTK